MTDRGGRRWRLVRARPDAVPSSVRRFTERARRRRLRAALPWAVGAAVLALLGLIGWLVYSTPLLGVGRVRVSGTGLLSAGEVRAAAGVAVDTPLARVDLDRVRERVAELPPVDHATVSRDWPDTLVIEVQERIAVAVVPRDGRFLLLDVSGVGYHSVPEAPSGLPLFRLSAPGPSDSDTRSALRVLGALTDELRDELTEVVVGGPARITLKLRKGRSVVWGDATENEKKAKVATALLDWKVRTIDVSAPEVVTTR